MAPIFPNEILFQVYGEYIASFKGTHVMITRGKDEFVDFLKPCLINKAVWDEVNKHDYFGFLTFSKEIDLEAPATFFSEASLGLRRRIKHLKYLIEEHPTVITDTNGKVRNLDSHIQLAKERIPHLKSIHIIFNHNLGTISWQERNSKPQSTLSADLIYATTVVSTAESLRLHFGLSVMKAIRDIQPAFELFVPKAIKDHRRLHESTTASFNAQGHDPYMIGQMMVFPPDRNLTFYF